MPEKKSHTAASRFTFAHLSDIHFAGYEPGALFDVNSDIRRELVHDLCKLVDRAGGIDAILIGGDIAGSGQVEEYEAANLWLDELCAEFSVPPEMVFCVPGNHDVYRPAIQEDSIFQVSQRAILNCSPEQIDPMFEVLFTNKAHPGLLLRGLAPYNEFASRYLCGMNLDKHNWTWNLKVGDLKIHLVGLASAILCGPDDVQQAEHSQLALGPQARIPRFVDGTFTIALCHHPPNWFRDRDVVTTFLNRAHLQLYGHEHSFDLKTSGLGLRVDAGAVHPSRKEDPWLPSYNLISLYEGEAKGEVVVDIYPRQLLSDHTFGPREEGEDFRRQSVTVSEQASVDGPPLPAAESLDPDPMEERTIARSFLDLDRDTRLRIGKELELISEAEAGLPEGVRIRQIFDQARAQDRLSELEEKINA